MPEWFELYLTMHNMDLNNWIVKILTQSQVWVQARTCAEKSTRRYKLWDKYSSTSNNKFMTKPQSRLTGHRSDFMMVPWNQQLIKLGWSPSHYSITFHDKTVILMLASCLC